MSMTIAQFWKLVVESQLMSADDASKHAAEFNRLHGQQNPTVDQLVKWLVGSKLSPYQAKVLLSGRAGPFNYGDYQIFDRIEGGRGAMLFRAVHRATMHRVCLFFLSGPQAQDPQFISTLNQQALAANASSQGQPHLARCYHLVDAGAFKFIVLEDLASKRLDRQLTTQGALSTVEACRIVRQIAAALGVLHASGEAHGRVCPANIALDSNNQAKLLGFPLDRNVFEPAMPLEDELALGKDTPPEVDYAAPESFAQMPVTDPSCDVYALGCTLYHLLSGRPPYSGGDAKQKQQRHASETPRPLHEVNPQIPQPLSKIVNYMLAKDPEMRFQQMSTVIDKLAPFAGPDSAPPAPSTRNQAYEKWLQKHVPAVAQKPSAPKPSPKPAPVTATTTAPAAAPLMATAVMAPPSGVATMAQGVRAMPVSPVMGTVPAMAQAVTSPMMSAAPPVMAAAPRGAQPPAGVSVKASVEPEIKGLASVNASSAPRKRRKGSLMPLLIGVVLLGVALGGYMYMKNSNAKVVVGKTPEQTAAENMKRIMESEGKSSDSNKKKDDKGAKGAKAADSKTPPPTNVLAADDPREKIFSLDKQDPVWTAPTGGKPLELRYLPPGTPAIVVLRPAEIMKHPEAAKLLDNRVLGSIAPWFQNDIAAETGVPLDQIEQVTVSFIDNGSNAPTRAYVVRTLQSVGSDAQVAAWGNPEPQAMGDKVYFAKDGKAFFIDPKSDSRLLVIGPEASLKDVLGGDGTAILPPAIESMLKVTDSMRMLTCLFVPGFVLDKGKPSLSGPGAILREPLTWLMEYDPVKQHPRAVVFSAHLGAATFLELRLNDPEAGPQSQGAAIAMKARVDTLFDKYKAYTAALRRSMSDYSAPLLFDHFGDIVKLTQNFVRIGTMEKQIVARVYLPSTGAHNLALGSYLCLVENPASGFTSGDGGGTGGGEKKPAPTGTGALAKMQKPTTLMFDRNPFEVAIKLLSDDIGVPIVILGGDLQIEGITKNQSMALMEENKPAMDILKAILIKANPAGKLVYLVKKNAEGEEELHITTRKAVGERKETLTPDQIK